MEGLLVLFSVTFSVSVVIYDILAVLEGLSVLLSGTLTLHWRVFLSVTFMKCSLGLVNLLFESIFWKCRYFHNNPFEEHTIFPFVTVQIKITYILPVKFN